ncbi:MAG: S8 family serine peptidase [Saprospiraceae bacterium]|nr:S8 family serine peptidase [Saprospiraceae bacterium]
MNNGRISLLLACIFQLIAVSALTAQGKSDFLPGRLLLSLPDSIHPEHLVERYATVEKYDSLPAPMRLTRMMNVWLVFCEPTPTATLAALQWYRQQPEVLAAQTDHILQLRSSSLTIPDDPLFANQWQYLNSGAGGGLPNADLDAPEAWDLGTGGLTAAGDTIVLAVIDGGFDAGHPDLSPNLWVNWADIPDDQIDNDGNGFADDRRGWNVYAQNDQISGLLTTHGTPVSGIIGARGNNGIGVSGVNWQTKIMCVVGSGLESFILSAYDYVWQERRLYNLSNGQKGAFVVAVNCSWGINYGQPDDSPLWCAAFDTLGSVGVLSVAATANLPIDVDQWGDLPTTCPSDYLVAVTSLNQSDQIAPNAAWGAGHVDLGAYGDGVFTTASGSNYAYFSGTSFAAPHVTGAVGLLYSSDCPELIALAKTNPSAAAFEVKMKLLENAAPNAALTGVTASNGRLNLFQLLDNEAQTCSDCPAPFALFADPVSTEQAVLQWQIPGNATAAALRWRPVGQALWNELDGIGAPFVLSGLSPCQSYEFALQSACGNGTGSGWTAPVLFQTDGCCTPPAQVWFSTITAYHALVHWTPVTAASGYMLQWRPQGSDTWASVQLSDTTSGSCLGLLPCTGYELRLKTLCNTDTALFSASYFFTTTGCGACTDASYCTAGGLSASTEWIAGIQIGAWSHNSGGFIGYQAFTGIQSDLPVLLPLSQIPVTIWPGYAGSASKVFLRIFVDFNADGDFDDWGELAFDPGFAVDVAYSGFLQTPDFWAFGPTRLRIMLKFKEMQGVPPAACEWFPFGQVKDYCAQLNTGGLETTSSASQPLVRVFPQPANEQVWLTMEDFPGKNIEWAVWSAQGNWQYRGAESLTDNTLQISTADWLPGVYLFSIQSCNKRYQGKIIKI